MSSDPLQAFVQQLAVQIAAGALSGTWAKVKDWILRHRRATGPAVEHFERDPLQHQDAFVALLRQMRFETDPEARSILAEGLTSSHVTQTASGHVVVQAGRDATVYVAGAGSAEPEPAAESAADRAYQQHTMWASATGGEAPAVRIVARMPNPAPRFDADDFMALAEAAYEYLNVYAAGLPLKRRSSEHVEFETERTADGRRIMIHALADGVIDLVIFRSWPVNPGVPWDWVGGEVYTSYLWLNDDRVRRLYDASDDITVFPKVANLQRSRVTLQGIKGSLSVSGSDGDTSNLVLVPLVWREWSLYADQDPWPSVREFLRLALADSGAFRFEKELDRMESSYFQMLYFEQIAPSVRFWRPGQPPPQAV